MRKVNPNHAAFVAGAAHVIAASSAHGNRTKGGARINISLPGTTASAVGGYALAKGYNKAVDHANKKPKKRRR